MTGETYNPLGLSGDVDEDGTFHVNQDSEYMRFRRAAKEGDDIDELCGLTMSSTGIRVSTMAHMRPWWWHNPEDEPAYIEIPYGEDCELGGGLGSGRSHGEDVGPCYRCQTRPDKPWAPPNADYTPKSEAAVRIIPVHDDDTIRILDAYFDLNDKVITANTITERIKGIGERAGLDRKVVSHDLRDTYGTLLAKKGFGVHQIKTSMGHANIEEALKYVKLAGRDIQEEYDDKW